MSILIGHASISETGSVNGAKGDGTGREVCTRSWYDGGWRYMALHPDAAVREKHARAIEAACANNNIGYGQSDRNSLYELAKAAGFDMAKVGKCNCDCSSLQNVAAVASGAPGVSYGSNGWTTPDWSMRTALKAAGYVIITDSALLKSANYCVRGAIYVSSGHTVCGLSNGSAADKTLAKVGSTEVPVTQDPVQISTAAKYHSKIYLTPMHLLAYGDEGPEVESLQLLLHGKGFDCGAADGIFGPMTASALRSFQKAAGLDADGEYGGLSQAALLCYSRRR